MKKITIFSLLTYLTLASIPLFPVWTGSSLVAEMKIYDILIFLLFITILIRKILNGKTISFSGALFAPFLLLLLSMLISHFGMALRNPDEVSYKDIFLFVKMFERIFLYWMFMEIMSEYRLNATRAFLIIGGAAILVAFLQLLGYNDVAFLMPVDQFIREHYNVLSEGGATWDRIGATFEGNPNNLGAYATFFALIFMSQAMYRKNTLKQKILFLVFIAFGVAVILATLSRGAVLNITAGASMIVLLSRQIRPVRKLFIIMAIAVVAILIVTFFGDALSRIFTLKELVYGTVHDGGFTVRLDIWIENISMILSDPISFLIGIGPVMNKDLVLENYYFATFVRYGIVGIAAVFFLIFRIFRVFLSTLKKTGGSDYALVIGLFAGVTGMLIQCISGDFFNSARLAETYWISFAIMETIHRSADAQE